jgi:hypothetical protein
MGSRDDRNRRTQSGNRTGGRQRSRSRQLNVLVVDDHILFRILAHQVDPTLGSLVSEGVVTTASWYYRLARAITAGDGGSLSRPLARLSIAAAKIVRGSLDRLPDTVSTLDPRITVPVMAAIAPIAPSNFLTLEALATAIATGSDIATTTPTPLLRTAADRLGVTVHIIA